MNDLSDDEIISRASKRFSRGEERMALKIIEDALLETPQNLNLLNALGDLCLTSGNNDGAIDAYRKSLKVEPQQIDVLFNLALIHTEQKNFDKALIAYDAILEMNPRDIDARNNRGNIYQKESRHTFVLNVTFR
jgi:tetratricopeptide (TPR) repeat protein